MRRIFTIAASALILGTAAADTVTLTPLKDNTLFEDAEGDLSAGATEYFFAGKNNNNQSRRGVVAFNLASIPAGSTVTSVTMSLYMSRTQAGNQNVTLHRLLANWGEGTSGGGGQGGGGFPATTNDATWQHRFYPSQFWTNVGGDFTAAASATTVVGSSNGSYSWTGAGLVADVQGWVNNAATNFGWLVRGNEAAVQTAKRFNSRENGQASRRPMLTVVYTPPAITGACCFGSGTCSELTSANCAAQGGTYQGNGTDCSPNPCTQPTGACCFSDGSCTALSSATCAAQGGSYQGNGSVCTPNPCPQPTGACCFNNASCQILTGAQCSAQGGTYQGNGIACAAGLCPLVLVPFVDPLPIPAVAQPTSGQIGGVASYTMAIREVQQRFHRDLPLSTVWGYGGTYPGPTIVAGSGLPTTVTWWNDLREGSGSLRTTHYLPVDLCMHGPDHHGNTPRLVTHLHGGHVPMAVDGYPEWTQLPGESATYVYPNDQPAGTTWYHDHALGITRLNVYMGLAGFYLIRDSVEESLDLPEGEYEIGLAIQDRSLNPDGTLSYPAEWMDHFFGDFMVVNGKVWPYLNVKQGKYRFRMLNGCTSRVLTLSLSNGGTLQQIGTDLGLLPAPVPLTQLTLATGERADVVIDFAGLPAGTEIILMNSAPAPYPGEPGVGVLPNVMKFIVTSSSGHTSPLPGALRPVVPIAESEADRSREMTLRISPEACAGEMWLINGLRWDDITDFMHVGDTEIWSFINRSAVSHPMHLHLVQFQVLDRQDFDVIGGVVTPIGPRIPPPASEAGWKDTVRTDPNQITRIIARFDDYAGLFPYHCHILEHEDHEMMRQFEVLPACPADCAAAPDGAVSVADLLALLAQWGTDSSCDVNNDGDVDVTDLLALLAAWGDCS